LSEHAGFRAIHIEVPSTLIIYLPHFAQSPTRHSIRVFAWRLTARLEGAIATGHPL
jgi:hypothetical protein